MSSCRRVRFERKSGSTVSTSHASASDRDALAGRRKRSSLRERERRLDRAASVLDVDTDIDFRQTVGLVLRLMGYFKLFKGRIGAKMGFITLESLFRLMIAPWPGKVVVDHVILGLPIADGLAGFPAYLAPFVRLLDGMGPVEIMLWILVLGVFSVAVFGFTTNRGTGRTATGVPSGASAGSSGGATYIPGIQDSRHGTMAQGHDTATQTENQANLSSGMMGGILGVLDFRLQLRLTQSMNHVLRTKLAGRIKQLPMTTLDDQRIGDSVFRVLYDSTSASLLLDELSFSLYGNLLGMGVTLAIMFTVYGNAPEVILLAILTVPIMVLFVGPFARLARRRSQASRAAGSSTTSSIEEGMSNILAVQSLGGNRREGERFRTVSEESFRRFRVERFVRLLYQQFGGLAFTIGQMVFFLVMVRSVIDGTFTAGGYFVVSYYFFVLSASLTGLTYLYTDLQKNLAGLRRFFFLMDLPVEKTDEGSLLPAIADGVVMEEVGLTYPDGRRALEGVNLEARIGEVIAFVGPTGAGKTSLAYLVPAFVQATEGTVRIDGVDLKELSVDSLREQVSYVFQETQLFSDTILENIRYGNPEASRERVEQVARVAGAHDFITALPEGYDTPLGTVTSKLSVGQKQRIAIARGLLRDARILILDEPTSALDPETEAYLVDALREAAKDRLVIIIAHRLSTVAHADRIYFLEGGVIREQGSHEELMAKREGRYREYVALQASHQ